MKTLFLVGPAVAAIFAASTANAVVLDLGALPRGELTGRVRIGEFVLTPGLEGPAIPFIDAVGGRSVLRGTELFAASDTFLTRVNGGTFTLDSVDIGLIPGFRRGQAISSTTTFFSLNDVATTDLQTVTFDEVFANVRWLRFDMLLGPYFTNIVVTPGIVPEPESWTLLVAGFGLIGMGLRRSGARLRAPTMPPIA